jgi:hypothetical protein
MLSIKARKILLIVAPRGCGKSRATTFVSKAYPECLLQDRLSIAGLAALRSVLDGFRGVITIDDIAKTQTPYARISTITTLTELISSHYVHSHLKGINFDINNFYGSALVNVQPVLLKEVVHSDEWEASIQDKGVRYYHLWRPRKPNPDPPQLKLEWGIPIEEVKTPSFKYPYAKPLLRIGEAQWGFSRLQEHLSDYLKAAAALDGRKVVNKSDYLFLSSALNPLKIETVVTDKAAFESGRYFHSNRLAILTEFVTYGHVTLEQIARDYKLSESQARRIMAKYSKDWIEVSKSPTTYAPSAHMARRLSEGGL